MSFTFRPGVRENVGLLIGLVGPSGGGKTYTAMELASGIAGDKPFAVIDTEARRALHYADRFRFDHGDLKPPFRPDAYTEAIKQADADGYPVIVVDSISHAHDGDGGLLDWHEEELERMAGDDWKKRERCTQAAWIKPKASHKRMVQRFLQVRAHLILCLRAEEKTKMLKNDKGKVVPTNIGFQPICEKKLPFELTVSVMLLPDNPGFPIPIKLQEQHRELFLPDRLVTARSGMLINKWAAGGEPAKLEDVLSAIRGAEDIESLKEVGADLAGKQLRPDETKQAREAYKDRMGELRPAESPCAAPDCDKPAVGDTFKCEVHQ